MIHPYKEGCLECLAASKVYDNFPIPLVTTKALVAVCEAHRADCAEGVIRIQEAQIEELKAELLKLQKKIDNERTSFQSSVLVTNPDGKGE